MKLTIEDKTLEINMENTTVDELVKTINQEVRKSNKNFSHLVIDEIEIFENFQNYIEKNKEFIEQINVITKKEETFVKEIITSLNDYYNNALPEIEKLADVFYTEHKKEDIDKLIQLFDGIKYIFESYNALDKSKKLNESNVNYNEWLKYSDNILKLKDLINDIEYSLNNKDYVNLADILSYELIPSFKENQDITNLLLN